MDIRTAHRDELPLLRTIELAAGVLAIRGAETAFGLDPGERIFMLRTVAAQ